MTFLTGSRDKHSYWLFLGLFMLYLVIISFLILTGYAYTQYNAHARELDVRLANEKSLVRLSETMLTRDLQVIASDLFILAESEELLKFLDNRNVQNLRALENRFLRFANDRKYYGHIAFIDQRGKEEARVNSPGGESVRVTPEKLQDKSTAPYFTETRNKARGYLYVSPLDLNIEFGTIEKPYKPTIRVVTPVFNRFNRRRGIIVLNYRAEYMLERLHEHLSDEQREHFSILNADGYWVDAWDADKLWSFMFDGKHSFKDTNPAAWQAISEKTQGVQPETDATFTFTSLYPRQEMLNIFSHKAPSEDPGPRLILISKVPAEQTHFYLDLLSKENHAPITILLLLSGLFAWQLARANVIKTEAKRSLQTLAISDPLTSICNRRYFIERVETELSRSARYKVPFSIAILDIDYFKSINDRHGHQVGDEVLLHMVSLIGDSLRSSDIFARYGGEEFVIGLPETNLDETLQLCERIRSLIADNPMQSDQGTVCFTVSIGCTERTQDETDIDIILGRADKALYEAKSLGRNQTVSH